MNKQWFYVAFILLSACWVGLQTTSVYTAIELLFHKTKMHKAEFDAEHLVTLSFSQETWKTVTQVGNHEIEVNQQRFDIKQIQHDGDDVLVTGVYDTWETNWLLRTSKHHPEGVHPLWLAFFYFEQTTPYTFNEPTLWINKTIGIALTQNVLCDYHQSGFKPPEINT